MKKNTLYFIIFILFLAFPISTKAETNIKGYILKADTLFASKDNLTIDSCLVKENGKFSSVYAAPNALHCLDSAEEITILNYDSIIISTTEDCQKGYYYATAVKDSKTYNGYVCADHVQANIDTSKYKDEFIKAGFPESYFEKLTVLKDAHPNWTFTAYKTNLKWDDVVNSESIVGMSYIQVTDLEKGSIYISLDEGSYDPVNQAYLVREGSNWYAANKQTVAYYLDPRNFLVEKEIFMFENLSYNEKYQTLEVVQNVLKGTGLYDYASTFMEAATYNGNSINPVSLAASSRQEIVLGDGKLSGSADGTGKIDDVSYYNVYNIGAFSSCENPIKCAIDFASGYIESENPKTTFNRPWTTMELAILNGANYIAEAYINQKQNTIYFKKWNVTSNTYGNYSNQYMTNIRAGVSEGKYVYEAYSKIDGLLDSAIEFIIPVYENMPAEAVTLPTSVDTETKEKVEEEAKEEVKEQTSSIVDIINASGYKYNSDYISDVKIGTSVGGMKSKLNPKNESITIKISTTDSSGKTTELGDSSTLGTGDIITITSGEETKSFRVVIYGDANGDGKISAVDYVKIKNYIMSSGDLSGSYKLAADVNKDGNISAVDYVNVKNYIMGNNSVLK